MTGDARLDEELRLYLAHERAMIEGGATVANLRMEIHQFAIGLRGAVSRIDGCEAANDLTQEQLTRHGHRLDMHANAIIALKRRARKGDDDEEMNTGTFDVAAIQARLAEQEKKRSESERARAEDRTWWKRATIMWLVGGLGFIAATAVTVLITMAVANSRPQQPTQQPAPQMKGP